jgi:hypothetical protein
MTNWYSVFYWLSVADGVKSFFNVFSDIFTGLSVVSLILMVIMLVSNGDSTINCTADDDKRFKYWISFARKSFIWCLFLTLITWGGYVMVPTKRDCYVIVAGGAVGNFIQSDSSAKKIPSEALQLLRDKMREESKDLSLKSVTESVTDTLKDKTKEELIEMVKNNKIIK